MVVNIGHGNRNVLDAMKRQMDRATFAYRLHFENEPAEELAQRAGRPHARRPRPDLLRVGRFGGGGILPQAGAAMGGGHRPAEALEGDLALCRPITAARSARSAVTGDGMLTDTFAPTRCG